MEVKVETMNCLHLTVKNGPGCLINYISVYFYCINECLVWSCSVSVNNCKSESVKLLPEATLKVTNGQNSCTGWASAVLNINGNKQQYCIH